MTDNRQSDQGICAEVSGNPEFDPTWDVLRDADGNPVTITEQQMSAIWHAVSVVELVRRHEGYGSMWGDNAQANLWKSRLLGRMVLDGKPPTRSKPPTELSGPCWWLLPGGDPFV